MKSYTLTPNPSPPQPLYTKPPQPPSSPFTRRTTGANNAYEDEQRGLSLERFAVGQLPYPRQAPPKLSRVWVRPRLDSRSETKTAAHLGVEVLGERERVHQWLQERGDEGRPRDPSHHGRDCIDALCVLANWIYNDVNI